MYSWTEPRVLKFLPTYLLSFTPNDKFCSLCYYLYIKTNIVRARLSSSVVGIRNIFLYRNFHPAKFDQKDDLKKEIILRSHLFTISYTLVCFSNSFKQKKNIIYRFYWIDSVQVNDKISLMFGYRIKVATTIIFTLKVLEQMLFLMASPLRVQAGSTTANGRWKLESAQLVIVKFYKVFVVFTVVIVKFKTIKKFCNINYRKNFNNWKNY